MPSHLHHVCQEAWYVQPYFPCECDLQREIAKNCVDGRQERVQFDKITARVSRLCYGLDADHVDPVAITQKVISGVYGGVTTVQLDDLVSFPDTALTTMSYVIMFDLLLPYFVPY